MQFMPLAIAGGLSGDAYADAKELAAQLRGESVAEEDE
jgi:hypothetical protein